MKKLLIVLSLVLVLACILVGCSSGNGDTSSDSQSDTAKDSDIISDTELDTDTDTDSHDDSDTDTDSDVIEDETDSDTNDSDTNQKPDTSKCDHSFTEWLPINEATCTDKGSETRKCTLCNKQELRYVEAKGHTIVTVDAVEGNCKKDGATEGKYCSVCDEVIKKQTVIPKEEYHKFNELVKLSSSPSFSSSGKGTFKCSACGETREETLPKLSVATLGKNDVYDITATDYNPALDNVWKVVNGKTSTAGFYSPGDDWFGNVGDVLTITLGQEVLLTELNVYVCGNYTTAKFTVKNAKGQTVASKQVRVDSEATKKVNILSNSSGVKAYTVEVEIQSLKWESAYTYKVAEVEMKAAKPDVRLDHDHVYREYVKDTVKATCKAGGKAEYACYCSKTAEKTTPIGDHVYNVLISSKPVSCTENGKDIYRCETCSYLIEKKTPAKGHIYAKLVSYISKPTSSKNGEASFKCIGCNKTETRTLMALPLGEVEHLRVSSISANMVVLKFNIYGEVANYEIRYSTSEITPESFESATLADATVKGDKEYTAEIKISANLKNCYYVAIRPYINDNYGEITTIRVGGNELIPIDYHSGNVYHGELLNSFAKLFDEQNGDRSVTPSSQLPRLITDKNDSVLYNMDLSPIVDLEYSHYVSSVFLYYAEAGMSVKVRWSTTPVDAYAEDSKWDGYYSFTSKSGWNEIKINQATRYIQLVFKDGTAPYEMLAYGFQNGEGDKIATEIGTLPTMGEMMGMCGFVAAGGGNTPIDSVRCTTVLREYHKILWSYKFEDYPNKATFFTGSWMGDFDAQYRDYTLAGINVIPCIQWDLEGTPLSYKVDENNLPKKSGSSFVKGSFWDKMNPHTYFLYADNMFSFAARFGTNTAIADVLNYHCLNGKTAGLGYIKWIELGNEPEGVWNGIHNYYSAYQLAALTSAAYDGHCRTLTSTAISRGYHFGVKNGDPNMGAAMAGVSAVSNEYITAMCYWMKANRQDGKTSFDAFNVHCYMTKSIELPNGGTTSVGISPEEAQITKTLSQLLAIRDKYYPEKEFWITEFGWDTNQSYATATSAHGYENKETGVSYTGREVQAMWLTRTYLLLSAIGVDKATMYMCEDCGVEEESVGKYGTAGVIGFKYDEKENVVEFKKDSYYYLSTLKNALFDYTFNQQIEAYDENVTIYQYKTAEGKIAYAVWCGTSDGTVVNNYQLRIDSDSATLIENEYGDEDGLKSTISADSLGYVSVNVSEKPIYIIVD